MKISAKFLILFAILSTVAAEQTALAKTIAVTSTADNGPGSLRQALATAANGDKINIVANGTIALTSGELLVNKSVTINGLGPHGIVSGNGASRVFHITPNMTVTISSLTITKIGRAHV